MKVGFAWAAFGGVGMEGGSAGAGTVAAADLDVTPGFEVPEHGVGRGGIARRVGHVPARQVPDAVVEKLGNFGREAVGKLDHQRKYLRQRNMDAGEGAFGVQLDGIHFGGIGEGVVEYLGINLIANAARQVGLKVERAQKAAEQGRGDVADGRLEQFVKLMAH